MMTSTGSTIFDLPAGGFGSTTAPYESGLCKGLLRRWTGFANRLPPARPPPPPPPGALKLLWTIGMASCAAAAGAEEQVPKKHLPVE